MIFKQLIQTQILRDNCIHMKRIIATVEIWAEGGIFTSYCPELDIASCGHKRKKGEKLFLS